MTKLKQMEMEKMGSRFSQLLICCLLISNCKPQTAPVSTVQNDGSAVTSNQTELLRAIERLRTVYRYRVSSSTSGGYNVVAEGLTLKVPAEATVQDLNNNLQKLGRIVQLDVWGFEYTNDVKRNVRIDLALLLQDLREIETLKIDGSIVVGFEKIHAFPFASKLKKLIVLTPREEMAFASFADFKSLESIWVDANISQGELRVLKGLSNLKELSIGLNKGDAPEHFKELADFPALESLELGGLAVSAELAASMARSNKLRSWTIRKITPRGNTAAVTAKLAQSQSIVRLHFNNSQDGYRAREFAPLVGHASLRCLMVNLPKDEQAKFAEEFKTKGALFNEWDREPCKLDTKERGYLNGLPFGRDNSDALKDSVTEDAGSGILQRERDRNAGVQIGARKPEAADTRANQARNTDGSAIVANAAIASDKCICARSNINACVIWLKSNRARVYAKKYFYIARGYSCADNGPHDLCKSEMNQSALTSATCR